MHRHEPYGDEFLNLSDPKHVHKRAHARSYDTPLITRAYRSVNAPLGPELAAIRFLERMGYDVHYATGFDLSGKHADGILKRSRAYLSVGHDEYWTRGVCVHRRRGPHAIDVLSYTGTASATRSSARDVGASTSIFGPRTRPTGPCASKGGP